MIPEPTPSPQHAAADSAGDRHAGAHSGVDPNAFRQALGRYATGITVVTTTVGGVDHAMTANAFTSVSLQPPMVLVCVEKVTRFCEAVLASGVWAASVLAADDQETAVWFAARGRPLERQMDRVTHARGLRTGVPVLTRSLAVVEVRTTAVHDGGDHLVVVGKVLGVSTQRPDAAPLVYFASRYQALPAR